MVTPKGHWQHGRGWHCQMSVKNARTWLGRTYDKYPIFDGLNVNQAREYLDQLEKAGKAWITCGCKKTTPDGKCLGWDC